MVTRRRFVVASPLLALPTAFTGLPAFAAGANRIALVIGNDTYKQAPLLNARNDARAVAELLNRAQFDVDLRLDTKREDLATAIERFGRALKAAEANLGVFFYAGHGVQIEWRNYLVPVDASVSSATSLLTECIDLTALLITLGQQKGGSFVIILDACRDDPFGTAYRPSKLGLSQFDAPVGSLIAFATAPGKLATDGRSSHSTYTEHLLKELAIPGRSIEEALKRVRLAVRLATKGRQIPWESTSLESDVILFPPGSTTASTDKRAVAVADATAYAKLQPSTRPEELAAYLEKFPVGDFAEIVEARIEKLAPPPEHREVIAEALPAAASDNPYSKGIFRLARLFTVDDEATFESVDAFSGVPNATYTRRVTKIDTAADRIEFDDGLIIQDSMGNTIKTPEAFFELPLQRHPVELQVGKTWTAQYFRRELTLSNRRTYRGTYRMHITAREWLKVKAGEFHAFKIESTGSNDAGSHFRETHWVVPALNFPVQIVFFSSAGARLERRERIQLASYKQQRFSSVE